MENKEAVKAISLYLPKSVYDNLCTLAKKDDRKVSDYIRRLVVKQTNDLMKELGIIVSD